MEKWKDIEGFEGLYQVSDTGKVYSIRRNRILKPKTDKYGYYVVCLWKDKGFHRTIHRLVAQAFLERVEGKNVVNHKDMDKKNNDVSNLEWTTVKENTVHAYKNSKTFHDRCNALHLMSFDAVCLKIDAFYNGEYIGSYNSKKETAEALGISEKTIYNRLHNRFNSRSGYTFVLKGGDVICQP